MTHFSPGDVINSLPTLHSIIKSHSLVMNKSLGQHFLMDNNFNDKIVKHSGVGQNGDISGCLVLEIGAGIGSLTRAIIKQEPKKLIAVEYDRRFIPILSDLQQALSMQSNIQSSNTSLEVIHGDAMKLDLGDITSGQDVWIISNLPYNISVPLLMSWLPADNIKGMILMLQKESALRICADCGDKNYGRISVLYNKKFNTKILFEVKKELFYPPPQVDSVIVSITPKPQEQASLFPDVNDKILDHILKITFGFRRKMLQSSLKKILRDPITILQSIGIDPSARPESTSIEDFCKLAIYIDENQNDL